MVERRVTHLPPRDEFPKIWSQMFILNPLVTFLPATQPHAVPTQFFNSSFLMMSSLFAVPSFWGFPMFDRLPDWLRKELTSFIKYDGLPLGAVRGRGYCDLQRISKIKNTAFSLKYMEKFCGCSLHFD